MKIIDLDHVALHVSDVARSKEFYGEILEFPEKARPDFDFDGAWYAIGATRELHILGDREAPVHSDPRGTHFAIRVDDIESAAEFLTTKGIPFPGGIRSRPDGAKQIFFQDPDEHWVEFTFLP